jgi:uncharacterized protein
MLVVSVPPGGEVLETVERQAKQHGLTDAAIVALIGAVDAACISTMPASDPRRDIRTEYVAPMELSGTGELVDGRAHVHCVLALEGDRARSGHLHWARVQTHFVRVYLIRGPAPADGAGPD